ncbi:MAG TPA: YdeI/OmpD-associated family protein [Polyangiaceae bacterium]|jgi:hypothetical protein|nr:YdeI/OmpD-associated family protein [Polyangiaceae bacterium]
MPIRFRAKIELIGINPFVYVPKVHLATLFASAGRDRGPIPLCIECGGRQFRQNLVRYQGAWRLYLNGPMRKAAGKDVGDQIQLSIAFDTEPPQVAMHPLLERALGRSAKARRAFDELSPSRQKEILRYLAALKSEVSVARNVEAVVLELTAAPGRQTPAFMRSSASRSGAGKLS